MKKYGKLFTAMLSIGLLAGCASSPNLRVGIVSDTQSYPGIDTDYGQKNLQSALTFLKDKNIDALIYAGDISDNGNEVVYQEYHQIMERVFGKNQPETITIMGNHDYWKKDTEPLQAQRTFCEGMRIPSINTHKVVKGYDFIGLSPEAGECNGVYGNASGEFLHKAMFEAEQRDPNKPVFITTHQHALNTVYGSDGWGHSFITENLADYENAVHFSGHSHYALEDERSIYQKDFTAIGTSSLNYCELEGGRVNGSVPPDASKCVQFIYMEVFDDHIDFHRYNLIGEREIKPDALWRVELPLAKESFVYTDARAKHRSAPQFASDAQVAATVDATPFKAVNVSFNAATHDDFVHSYAITLQERMADGKWGEPKELLFFSDFYLGVEQMSDSPTLAIPAEFVNGNAEYLLTVTPIESFGKRGNTISTTLATPERAPLPPKK